MTGKKTEILHKLRDTLRFHEALGIHEYPLNKDVQRFLEGIDNHKATSGEQSVNIQRQKNVPESIDNLEQEINACTLCRLSQDTLGRIHGKRKPKCRLMVVGDWSSQSETFSPEILFGKEEDVMLWKMMSAMGVQEDQVYVTNCLKCCPSDSGKIDGTCEERCFSFLAREIAAVNPQVICAMGEMATRIIMGKKDPLARLRGRFGSYRYQSVQTFSVMPTFHPRFLLQHQEMKKATWNDLQVIMHRLNEN